MRKARQNIDLTQMTVFHYENNQSEQYKGYTGHHEYDIKSLATPKRMSKHKNFVVLLQRNVIAFVKVIID